MIYKKITIIEELKKEYVISSKGKEYLLEVSRNKKKFENWEYPREKENGVFTLKKEEPSFLISEWQELDKINRKKIRLEDEQKQKRISLQNQCPNIGCKYSTSPSSTNPLCSICATQRESVIKSDFKKEEE